MHRSILALLSLASIVEAWGPHRSAEFPNPPQPSFEQLHQYPFDKSLDWSVKTTYLIVHPHEEDVDYADQLNVVPENFIPTSTKLKMDNPNFGWWSGIRFGLGRYLPNHDKWDVDLVTTYLYVNNEAKTSVDPSKNQLLYTSWGINSIGTDLTKAVMTWRMNYFTWDLNLGRYYRLKPTFYIHPTIGLRAALIDIDYKTNYTKNFFFRLISGNTLVVSENDKLKADQDFWGIGPRIGSDFNFCMKYNFSIIGSLSASLLYGHDHVKEKINAFIPTGSFITPISQHQKADATPLRTNLEASIGLGWDKWVNNNSVHLATSFQFEVSEWFSMNSFFHVSELLSGPQLPNVLFGEVERHHGNLGYYGFSINLQVEF